MATRPEQGGKLHILKVLDEYTRECLVTLVAPSISSRRVIDVLDGRLLTRTAPEHLRSDNGPAGIPKAIKHWLRARDCQPLDIKPGSPGENPFIESFNAHSRTECLDR
jgi:transposase InsO family protein